MNPTSSAGELALGIRSQSLRMVARANASHIGSALSIADILAVLYAKVLRIRPGGESDPERDRFILSKGHACVAVYAVLAERGFLTESDLQSYGQNFSWLMNHISHKVNGVEFSTGSLGHGLPFGVGKALACRRMGGSWRTFVLLGDGEMAEGSNWEALLFAAHHKLNNLTAIIDFNNMQSLTSVEKTLGLEPICLKLASFGWEVVEVDGHNLIQLEAELKKQHNEKPRIIIARTIKGKGVSFMENSVEWHYKSPSQAELQKALSELGATE